MAGCYGIFQFVRGHRRGSEALSGEKHIYNSDYKGFRPSLKIARKLLKRLVGPPGFEPGTSCTPSKRASQAAPRPELSMTYENTPAICILASHTERFIQERKFLRGVTPATEQWYRSSFKAFLPVLSEPHQSTTALKGALMTRIQALFTNGRGNKAVSINTYLRCLKAFLRWAHEESILTEPVKLAWLKEEQKVLATFTADQVVCVARKPCTASDGEADSGISAFTVAVLCSGGGVGASHLFGANQGATIAVIEAL